MRSKEELIIAWIVLTMVAIPAVVLFPVTILLGIIGYCLYILYSHYSKPQRGRRGRGPTPLFLDNFQYHVLIVPGVYYFQIIYKPLCNSKYFPYTRIVFLDSYVCIVYMKNGLAPFLAFQFIFSASMLFIFRSYREKARMYFQCSICAFTFRLYLDTYLLLVQITSYTE